jgi:hypothetical protein
MPYREASDILKTCGFSGMRAGRMTIWRHAAALGRIISDQQCVAGYVYRRSKLCEGTRRRTTDLDSARPISNEEVCRIAPDGLHN